VIWSAHGNHTTHITNLTQSMYITQTLNKLKIVVSLPLVALIVYPFLRPLMNISGFQCSLMLASTTLDSALVKSIFTFLNITLPQSIDIEFSRVMEEHRESLITLQSESWPLRVL